MGWGVRIIRRRRINVCKGNILSEKTFKKGIHPPHKKETSECALRVCPAPEILYIPLGQHIGKPAVPVVEVGDSVKAGTLIGRADGAVSSNVFSSASGTVIGIEKRKTPAGACLHAVIKNDGLYETEGLPPMNGRDRSALLQRLFDAGLVGMGGAGFPSHVKYAPKSPVDTFIINGAECEPYITCDYRLLYEKTEYVLRGAAVLAEILGLKEFYVGIEDNKPAAVDAVTRAAFELKINAKTVVLKSKYPQGAEKQLIYAVTGRKVPPGKLPADVGVVVGNVHTAYAVYLATEENTPLYARALTVAGDVETPSNLWVRTGTLFSDCAEFCGGVKPDCAKTLSGGPMMGVALDSLDYSVGKTTGALLFLSAADANLEKPGPCINCARCAAACPMNLMPMYIDAYALHGNFEQAKRYGALNCIECGCCAFSCPAKRPIVQSVKLAKRKIKELGL